MQEDQAQKENSILKVLGSAGLNTLKETKCMKKIKIKILGKETQKIFELITLAIQNNSNTW